MEKIAARGDNDQSRDRMMTAKIFGRPSTHTRFSLEAVTLDLSAGT